MKKLPVLISVLALLFVMNACSANQNIRESATAPIVSSSADTTQEETPAVMEPTDESVNNEVYTKVIQLEGIEETVSYMLINGSFGYTMPLDVDRFDFRAGENADLFISSADLSVYIAVSFAENTSVDEQLQVLLGDEGIVSSDENAAKLGDYDATNLYTEYGSDTSSKVVDHYLIEDSGGVYVISCVYFQEAAEGLGARMYYMAQDFEIV